MTWLADARYAWRTFLKNPGFTLFAMLTLALGLGANVAIFSFLDGLLLKPLPYPEPERIVQIWEKPPRGLRNGVSALNFLDWSDQATSFKAMAARSGDSLTLTGRGEPRQLRAARVSGLVFRRPRRGGRAGTNLRARRGSARPRSRRRAQPPLLDQPRSAATRSMCSAARSP